ncbi:Helitron helicase [Phytophthora megakarya]|uniref:ATP-dependent DNA helicase n=1 Tax=Phytophthora megakarya TaxID=4795 RepID=A0A225VAN9_9STRA|nr:Helitron helicase [Phytophthora megakarya]
METYKTAALSLGFLESDEESHRCLLEASAFLMPRQLRHLFACQMISNLQAIPANNQIIVVQSIWHSEIYMNISRKQAKFGNPRWNLKSFLLEKILAYVRQKGGVALAVAGSGIAAQLFTWGRMAHFAFELPLDPHETSTCNIGSRSFDDALLKRANIIVWDEAPMSHRFQYEALDRTFQDLIKNNMQFGGITMLLCGDFRQILPVIPRDRPTEVISSTIKRSENWRYFEWLRLFINMRVQTSRNPQTAVEVGAFSYYILQVGDGRHFILPTLGPDFIKVPEDMLLDVSSLPQSNIEEQARHRLLHLLYRLEQRKPSR